VTAIFGSVGIGLLVAAGVAILVEMALAAVWGAAVARRAMKLAEFLKTEQGMLESDLKKLRLGLEEAQRLWRPYRRVLRWLRHPLTIALWQSYLRRGIVR
jgi:hypothetical protein